MLSNFYNLFIISAHNMFFQTRYHLEQLLEYAMLLPLSQMESISVMANFLLLVIVQMYSMVKDSSVSSASSPKRKMLLVNKTLTLARM